MVITIFYQEGGGYERGAMLKVIRLRTICLICFRLFLSNRSNWTFQAVLFSYWILSNRCNHTDPRFTFALRHSQPPPVHINNKPIPNSDTAKYVGLIFDKRLIWAKHIYITKLKLNHRLYSIRHILGKCSKLSLKTKIHIYNLLLKLIWLYGVQLRGTAKIYKKYQSSNQKSSGS